MKLATIIFISIFLSSHQILAKNKNTSMYKPLINYLDTIIQQHKIRLTFICCFNEKLTIYFNKKLIFKGIIRTDDDYTIDKNTSFDIFLDNPINNLVIFDKKNNKKFNIKILKTNKNKYLRIFYDMKSNYFTHYFDNEIILRE